MDIAEWNAEKNRLRELARTQAVARRDAGMGFARLVAIGALAVLLGNAGWWALLWIAAKLTATP